LNIKYEEKEQISDEPHVASISEREFTCNRVRTYLSEEALEKLILVNKAMDRRLLSRHRGCQRADPKRLQASGAKDSRQQRIVGCAVPNEFMYEAVRQTTEALEPYLSPESVV
jgi:hypothetical protein